MNEDEIRQLADNIWKSKYKLAGTNPYYSMGFCDAAEVAKLIYSSQVMVGTFHVGDKIPSKEMGYIKIMAFEDGYVMARYKGCMPWCVTIKEFEKIIAKCQ